MLVLIVALSNDEGSVEINYKNSKKMIFNNIKIYFEISLLFS